MCGHLSGEDWVSFKSMSMPNVATEKLFIEIEGLPEKLQCLCE